MRHLLDIAGTMHWNGHGTRQGMRCEGCKGYLHIIINEKVYTNLIDGMFLAPCSASQLQEG